MIHPWKVLKSKELFKTRIFRLRSDQCELPDGRVMPNYYVMEFPDWVNVIPVTKDGDIVLIEQYRHANGEVCLEIPGGSMDPGHPETPEMAARRELLEETGYSSDALKLIGSHAPNPAMQNNRMHTYLALNCELTQAPNLDPFEDIKVVKMPLQEVFDRVYQGQINHSIVVASLLLAKPLLELQTR